MNKKGATVCRYYPDFMELSRMYFQQAEHNPPHIHALYGEEMAAITIQSGEILEGHLPPKALTMVKEWVELHKIDLLQMWDTQEFKTLAPLE